MFNNVYGLRPTTRRLPYAGASNTQLGQGKWDDTLKKLITDGYL